MLVFVTSLQLRLQTLISHLVAHLGLNLKADTICNSLECCVSWCHSSVKPRSLTSANSRCLPDDTILRALPPAMCEGRIIWVSPQHLYRLFIMLLTIFY